MMQKDKVETQERQEYVSTGLGHCSLKDSYHLPEPMIEQVTDISMG